MIVLSDTNIENTLLELVQREVKMTINNKKLKRGKFLLFKQNNYFIEFYIQTPKKMERCEVPIPFSIERWDDGYLYFDYRIDTFIKNKNTKVGKIVNSLVENECVNKFYNSILEIEVINGF